MVNIVTTREKPGEDEKDRLLWWNYAKSRNDWYLLIVQDGPSGLEYPVFVPEFDSRDAHIAMHHRHNDQWVIAIYETWGD